MHKSEDIQLDLSLFLQLIVIMSETAQVLRMEFAKQQTLVSVIQDLLVTETLYLLLIEISAKKLVFSHSVNGYCTT